MSQIINRIGSAAFRAAFNEIRTDYCCDAILYGAITIAYKSQNTI